MKGIESFNALHAGHTLRSMDHTARIRMTGDTIEVLKMGAKEWEPAIIELNRFMLQEWFLEEIYDVSFKDALEAMMAGFGIVSEHDRTHILELKDGVIVRTDTVLNRPKESVTFSAEVMRSMWRIVEPVREETPQACPAPVLRDFPELEAPTPIMAEDVTTYPVIGLGAPRKEKTKREMNLDKIMIRLTDNVQPMTAIELIREMNPKWDEMCKKAQRSASQYVYDSLEMLLEAGKIESRGKNKNRKYALKGGFLE